MTQPKVDRSVQLMVGGALLVPWLFIWQGIDFTDQGYSLTLYRCFLHYKDAAAETGSIWLTTLLGGVWDALFGKLGVVSIRALWALCLSLGFYAAFQLTKRTSHAGFAALATLSASIFLSDRRETWFTYNTSSSVLWLAAAVCMTHGLVERRRPQLFAAGALLALLPFARFPNLLGLALLTTPGLAAGAFAERRSQWLSETFTLLLGAAAGVAVTALLMLALGHLHLYRAAIQALFMPEASQSGYGADSLLSGLIKDESHALAWGLGVCVVGLGLAQLWRRLPAAVGWCSVIALAGAGAFGMAGTDELWRFVVPGVCYWVLGVVALGLGRRSFEQRLVAFLALAVVFMAPLGSNNGIRNAHMGLWLAVPFSVALVASLDGAWLAGQGQKLAVLACLVLAAEGVHRGATYTYRDGSRSAMVASVGDPQLRGQLTTVARAKAVSEVLSALHERVAPGDYILAYEGTPLIQYLTRTRPYLSRVWLMGAEPARVVQTLAAEAPARTGCLPVAVLTTRSTRGTDWPRVAKRLEDHEPQRGVRAVLKAFLRAHHYHRTWDNGFFEILEPPGTQTRCR